MKAVSDTLNSLAADSLKFATDSIAKVANVLPGPAQHSWFEILLEKNPGVVTIFLTGIILPLGLVWINNRNSIKSKEIEKQLDEKYKGKDDIKNQERAIYSSLSKILFDVQQLHVALSGTCVDKNCIEHAVVKFDASLTKYHEEISNNLLQMPSVVIDSIYKFYGKISDLKISLKEFNDSKNFEMAHVSVYMYSTQLAETLIEIQEILIAQNEALVKKFDKTQQEMMKYCCGRKPPKELLEKYIDIIGTLKPTIKKEEIDQLRKMWDEVE